jgi:3-oxoacyl-[acyl-carrier-protein] synthase II
VDMAAALLARTAALPLQTPLDYIGATFAQEYGCSGGIYTNCSACAAGAQAIGEAFLNVREGVAEVAIAGGADSMLNPLGLGGFSLLRILSNDNDHPETACRPFDLTRQGTVLGEGAAFLVLEERAHAMRRGACIMGEVLGYGSSMDAFRLSDPEPSGRGAVLAMQMALRDAAFEADGVDCVNAHATGTPKNDVVETAAIKEALGARARQIPVHSVKSMTGHCIAASGAIEAVAAVLTLVHRAVPPTINLQHADPECDLDCCPGSARAFAGGTVLSNSFGFGGQNAAILFGRSDA